jgi:hypothetical protein
MLRLWTLAAGVLVVAAGCGEQANPSASSGGASTGTSPAAQSSASPEVNPGGDIPDTQQFVAFAMPDGAFTVKTPEGWARSESSGAVTFTSHFDSVTLMSMPAASAPTVDSVTAGELPQIQQHAHNVAVGPVSATTRTAGQAIRITYQADSAPDPVTGHFARLEVERYDFWRNGIEAVVIVAAPVGADNVDPWRTITDSFAWP